MSMPRRRREYNRAMRKSSVVRVRNLPLLGAITYISLAVMSLLGIQGLHTLQAQLVALGLCAAFGLLYHFVLRTGAYEKAPVLYFGSQWVVLVLLLLLQTSSVDALNFLFLIVTIQAALVLTRPAAILWSTAYYLTVVTAVFLTRGRDGFYAAAFYLVAYIACGFFGYILQQAELARERNQQLVEELQSTQEKLKELAVVEERNRLARDLHDSVKQQVFAISMQLSAARTVLSESDPAYAPVAQAEKLAQQAGAELTTLIHQLRPPRLERKSLMEAVTEYIGEWTRQNKIETEMNIGDLSVSPDVEQVLFRVMQEALANVARHSQANRAWVTLQAENDHVALTVQDDGIGYDTQRMTKGIGLDSMKERLAALNGSLEISSLPSQGTCLTAKVRRS